MKNKIISLLEGKKKIEELDFEIFQENIEFNKGIDTAIESVDEILEIIIREMEDIKVSKEAVAINKTGVDYVFLYDIKNKLKE